MPPRLRVLAIRWMAWVSIGRLGQNALRILGRLVLARLLWPEAFGLFTLAIVVVSGLRLCYQQLFQVSVIQRRALTPDLLATAHWSQVGLGAAGTITLLALAGPLSTLMGHPPAAPLLQVLGVQLLLGGASAVPRGWLWRQVAFRQLTTRGLLGEAIGAVTAVGAALAGAGVWSLVVQELLVDLVDIFLLWSMVPWRPRYHWSRREFLEMVRFGSPVVAGHGLDLLAQQGDRFVVGRAFGSEALGFYALALRVAEAVSESIGVVFARVGFPAFARIQDDPRRSRLGLLEAARFQALLTFPLLVGFGFLAGDLVPLVLGPRWAGAVPFAEIQAARALLGSLLFLPRAMLVGRGRQWLRFGLSVSALAAFAAGWLVGLPWGPLGVAGAGVGATALVVLLSLWMATLELPIRVRGWAKAILPAVVGASAMVIGMAAASWLLAGILPASRFLRVTVLGLVGGVCYVLPLAPWLARQVRRYLDLLREGVRPQDSPDQLLDRLDE